jgi:hypothetical protein
VSFMSDGIFYWPFIFGFLVLFLLILTGHLPTCLIICIVVSQYKTFLNTDQHRAASSYANSTTSFFAKATQLQQLVRPSTGGM